MNSRHTVPNRYLPEEDQETLIEELIQRVGELIPERNPELLEQARCARGDS